jgi:hypothetical protein
MMDITTKTLYSIENMSEFEKDVLVTTIRHKYVKMSNDHPHFEVLSEILAGLK